MNSQYAAPPIVSNGAHRSMEPDYSEEGDQYEIQTSAPSQTKMRFIGSSQQFPVVGERTVPSADLLLPPKRTAFRPLLVSNDKLGGDVNSAGGGGGSLSGWVRPNNSRDITNKYNPYSDTLPPGESSFDARTRSNTSMTGDKLKLANQHLDL